MEFKDVFRRVSEVLNAVAIPYMLTGSFAGTYYGLLRATHDIDIVIDASPIQLKQLVQRLQETDYYADEPDALNAYREQSMFNAVDNLTGWKIDFIFRKSSAYAQQAFQHRRPIVFQGARMFVATPEDLIVSKLEWARSGDSYRQLEDVAGVVKKQVRSLDFNYIEHWVKDLALLEQWGRVRKLADLD